MRLVVRMLVVSLFSVVVLSSLSAYAVEIRVGGFQQQSPFSIALDDAGVPRIVGERDSLPSLKTLAEADTGQTSTQEKRFCYNGQPGTDKIGSLKALVIALADAKDFLGHNTSELISLSVNKKQKSITVRAMVYDVHGDEDQDLRCTFEECEGAVFAD